MTEFEFNNLDDNQLIAFACFVYRLGLDRNTISMREINRFMWDIDLSLISDKRINKFFKEYDEIPRSSEKVTKQSNIA